MNSSESQIWIERVVLGACLRWPDAAAKACAVLTPADFTTHPHQWIFTQVQALWTNEGAVDLVSVAQALQAAGRLGEVKADYLADLFEACGTGFNVERQAGQIRDAALLRRMAAVCEAAAARCLKPDGPADQVLGDVEREVLSVGSAGARVELVTLAEAVNGSLMRLDARIAGHVKAGLPTGFTALDQVLGGFEDQEFGVVAARPSVGKTAWGLAFAVNAARAGVGVLFASIEQSRIELGQRVLAAQAGVDSRSLRLGVVSRDEQRHLVAARDDVARVNFWIDDASHQSFVRIAGNARRLRDRAGVGLVLVDYLQLVDPEDRRVARHEQVGTVARRLKGLARELRCPVVALAQLNREVEGRKDAPRLSDLRDSGEIEQHADVVLFLHREAEDAGDAVERQVIVAKNRNGPTGRAELTFRRDVMRFESKLPIGC